MAVQRRRRAAEYRPVASDFGVFICSGCSWPLQLEKVLSADVERVEDEVTGYIVFQHHCGCSAEILTTRRMGSYPSFLALFGKQPDLPYRAPFSWTGVAVDDPTVTRWRWEMDQVSDWDEFMLFLDDATPPAA